MTASFIDRLLGFIFSNQLLLIEVLFAVIIGLCIMWLFFNLQTEAKPTDNEKQLKEIEKALEKVILNTSSKPTLAAQLNAQAATPAAPTAAPGTPAVSPTPAAPGVAAAANTAELEKLKIESLAKTQKLTELEKALVVAKEELTKVQAQVAPAVNTDEFQKKIKELEARLAEYEIIEDDIANLSLYKEENARLKNELQKIKTDEPKAQAESPKQEVSKQELSKQEMPKPEVQKQETPKQEAKAQMATEAVKVAKEPEKAINSDKLVEEVSSIAAAPAPVPKPAGGEDKDTGEKLIEEFEGFMKDANKS